eukprot:16145608-Heterocapsa_arctica.AAC.1
MNPKGATNRFTLVIGCALRRPSVLGAPLRVMPAEDHPLGEDRALPVAGLQSASRIVPAGSVRVGHFEIPRLGPPRYPP